MQKNVRDRVFFMFGSANRDETIFECPETHEIKRDTSSSITFGAGPHFCAGAWVSKTLIADVALPMLFTKFPNLRLIEEVNFTGWAFCNYGDSFYNFRLFWPLAA